MDANTGKQIAIHSVYNLIGRVLPLIVAMISIPILIQYLGTARFGLLTVIWVFVGYFSLFDLGMGRTIIKLISERISTDKSDEIGTIFLIATGILTFLGLLSGVTLFIISNWLITSLLNIEPQYIDESITSFYWLALTIPVAMLNISLRGVLEAWQKFGVLNIVQTISGIGTYVAPVAVVLMSPNLAWVVFSLFIVRLVTVLVLFRMTLKLVNGKRLPNTESRRLLGEILGFGGWVTVSNIIDPVLNYLDRFVIGAVLTMSAVAYFATPLEVVVKLVVIPAALITSLFPAFSSLYATGKEKLYDLMTDSYHYMRGGMFLICSMGILLAEPILNFWLSEEFAIHSTLVLQILMLGFFVNSIAKIPYTHLQSMGRPDITAKIHLAELPFFVALIIWVTPVHGIIGVAIIRFLRLLIDMLLMMYFSKKRAPSVTTGLPLLVSYIILLAILIIVSMHMPSYELLFLISIFILIAFSVYFFFVESDERHRGFLLNFISSVKKDH